MNQGRLELAQALCRYAHAGQVDKGGAPYYLHPFAVAEKVEGEDEKIAALLHDVLEDTNVCIGTIQNLFGAAVTAAVLSLTRKNGESYVDFIERAKVNRIGRAVKIADLEHNMDTSRLEKITSKDVERLEKYRAAYDILKG